MKRLIALAGLLLLPALMTAQEKPPELRLPKLKPVVLDSFVKSAEAVDPNVAWLKVPEAWKLTRGEGVTLHVGDTGIDPDHPEFKGVAIERKNYTPNGLEDKGQHGTHVAGTIVGQKEVSGVAPRVKKVVSHKVLGDDGSGSFAWMTKSIREAMKEPGVYNASLGSGPSSVSPDQFDPDLRRAIEDGIAAGMIFVFAAGNDGPGADTCGYPARFAEVIPDLVVVAAANYETSLVADFSSRGRAVFTVAPGVNIIAPLPQGRYAAWDGTSMASPHVAGLACLWLSANPDVPKGERQKRFAAWLRSASRFPDERHPARGYGRPDASKLTGSKPPVTPDQPPPAEKVFILDLAKLKADGYTSVRLDLGGGQAQAVPVRSVPSTPQPGEVYYHPQPVATWTGYNPAPLYSPPPIVYQTMPTCPPGGCQPAPQYLFAPFGGRFR
jgi:subtilisin family serine protease